VSVSTSWLGSLDRTVALLLFGLSDSMPKVIAMFIEAHLVSSLLELAPERSASASSLAFLDEDIKCETKLVVSKIFLKFRNGLSAEKDRRVSEKSLRQSPLLG